MKQILFFLAVLVFNPLSAQKLVRDSLIGKWICQEVDLIGDEKVDAKTKSAFEMMKQALVNAEFTFGEDGIFTLKLPANTPPEMNEMKFLDNRKWFYDQHNNKVSIGTRQENIAQINVIWRNNSMIFQLEGVPLELHMIKS
jgi:hypothetical protein